MQNVNQMKIEYSEVERSFQDLFGINPPAKQKEMKVTVREWEFPNPEVPRINQKYYFTMDMLRDLLPYMVRGKGQSPYVYGTHGTSKTSSIEQLAARLGRTCLDTDASENLEVIDLIGQMMPNAAGGFSFRYGLLARAMKEGHVLVINEYDLLSTLEQKALNRIVEDRQYTIVQTGEVIKAHPDFRLFFTGNTNNTGSTANFASSGSGDSSINDRLKFVRSKFLPKEIEKQILQDVIEDTCIEYGLSSSESKSTVQGLSKLVDVMIEVATSIRKSHEAAESSEGGACLECCLSIRSLKEWCRTTFEYHLWDDQPLVNAFETSFVAGVRVEEQSIVRQVLKSKLQFN